MALHSVSVFNGGLTAWDRALTGLFVFGHTHCICVPMFYEIWRRCLLSRCSRVNTMFNSFMSGETSGLYTIFAYVAFNLLSFVFAVSEFGMVSHPAFVRGGTYACSGRLRRANHSFCFCWVSLESHGFKQIDYQIGGSL
jgi:hypothetical protein